MISAALGCVWVILISLVALMPYPQHRPYALAMLVLFPFVLGAVAWEFGWLWALLLFLGAASIYRYPLIFLVKWLRRKVRARG